MTDTVTEETQAERELLTKLLDEYRPMLMEFDDDALERVRVGGKDARDLTAEQVKAFAPLLPRLEPELSPARAAERKAQYERVADLALIYDRTERVAQEPWTPAEKQRKDELTPIVRQHDTFLMSWARPVFADDAQVQAKLDRIASGTGPRDDAHDVADLVEIFHKGWHRAEGRSGVTQAYLAQAEADATESLRLQQRLELSESDAVALYRRAYTAWARDYEDLMKLGRYLMGSGPDADKAFKGIFAISRSKPQPVPSTPAESTPAAAQPAPAEPVA